MVVFLLSRLSLYTLLHSFLIMSADNSEKTSTIKARVSKRLCESVQLAEERENRNILEMLRAHNRKKLSKGKRCSCALSQPHNKGTFKETNFTSAASFRHHKKRSDVLQTSREVYGLHINFYRSLSFCRTYYLKHSDDCIQITHNAFYVVCLQTMVGYVSTDSYLRLCIDHLYEHSRKIPSNI